MKKKQAYNPFLPFCEYIPDGEPHVFGNRVYLFGSHDRFDGDKYCMNDYVCYSADTENLSDWQYEGVIYRKDQDPRNLEGSHNLWAPDVVKGLDGKYYLYYCLDVLPEIGVAICDTPAGEYQYMGLVRYDDGTPLGRKEGDYIQFDPGVFIDDDSTIYLYSGNASRKAEDQTADSKNSQVMKLCQDMMTIKERPSILIPTLHNSMGTGYEGHEFFEASSIRKIKDTYYFVYSDVQSFSLSYAVSKRPDRGFQFGGQLIALGDVGLSGRSAKDSENYLGNTHGGMECIGGQWYIFYHRQTNRTQYSRQACAEKITILPDGTIPQVEMTSCGLNGGPLAGTGRYMAAIACNLWGKEGAVFSSSVFLNESHPYFTQDRPDGDENATQYVANMREGAVAGYKYFDFQDGKEVTVTVRGNGNGCFRIAASPNGETLGEVSVTVETEEWKSFSAPVRGLNGVLPLYFHYTGNGSVDFLEFQLS